MKLKIIAIIRRTFERLLFHKMKDWQDREDLVQYADVKMFDPQAVSDLLDSIPMDRMTKGTPFPLDMVQYFFKKGIRRNSQYWGRFWTKYWTDNGYDVDEYLICEREVGLRWLGLCSVVTTDKGIIICQIKCYKYFGTIQEAFKELANRCGISKIEAVKYKSYRGVEK